MVVDFWLCASLSSYADRQVLFIRFLRRRVHSNSIWEPVHISYRILWTVQITRPNHEFLSPLTPNGKEGKKAKK